MALTAKGHRILIKPDPIKEQHQIPEALAKSGFEVAHTAEEERRHEVATQIGTVVSVGNTAWKAYDGKDSSWEPWCKAGDRVIFARYSGKIVEDPTTHEKFMVINDDDIQVVVTGELSPFSEE